MIYTRVVASREITVIVKNKAQTDARNETRSSITYRRRCNLKNRNNNRESILVNVGSGNRFSRRISNYSRRHLPFYYSARQFQNNLLTVHGREFARLPMRGMCSRNLLMMIRRETSWSQLQVLIVTGGVFNTPVAVERFEFIGTIPRTAPRRRRYETDEISRHYFRVVVSGERGVEEDTYDDDRAAIL